MTVYIDGHGCHYEVQATCMLFLAGERIVLERGCPAEFPARHIYTGLRQDGGACTLTVRAALDGGSVCAPHCRAQTLPPDAPRQETERAFGRMLYAVLREITGIAPPWGILTGVRPVKLFAAMMDGGARDEDMERHFREALLVSDEKIALARETALVQRPFLRQGGDGLASLYVAIPFCPSRCRYCSFVSHSIARAEGLVAPYAARLCAELAELGGRVRRHGLALDAVYVGGGTPTSLPAAELEAILRAIRGNFDWARVEEFTAEAGRPDTVTSEKLALLRRYGVDRISVNPQTFSDDVLRLAGRPHTAADAREKYLLAREYGFSAINMDFIAGLEGDTPEGFASTIAQAIALRPENITVHALSVKRSADLSPERGAVLAQGQASEMVSAARHSLAAAGYRPYYLYRQKNTVQNLENTGYSLPGRECAYNIRIMDESRTILAAGAGGVTKLVNGPEIRRIFNFKYPYEYIRRFDELAARHMAIDEFFSADPADA